MQDTVLTMQLIASVVSCAVSRWENMRQPGTENRKAIWKANEKQIEFRNTKNTIQYNSIQFNTIQYNSIHSIQFRIQNLRSVAEPKASELIWQVEVSAGALPPVAIAVPWGSGEARAAGVAQYAQFNMFNTMFNTISDLRESNSDIRVIHKCDTFYLSIFKLYGMRWNLNEVTLVCRDCRALRILITFLSLS